MRGGSWRPGWGTYADLLITAEELDRANVSDIGLLAAA
jgi:hypothetical protein